MLILARRHSQRLMIGDDITIEVVGICGQVVKLGIQAPSDVPVHREEIYQRVKAEQEANIAKSDDNNS